MGYINEKISRFQIKCEDNDCQGDESIGKKVAEHVDVFIVRDILSKLCYPIGYHASIGFTGDQLFPLVWVATRILEGLGFKVMVLHLIGNVLKLMQLIIITTVITQ